MQIIIIENLKKLKDFLKNYNVTHYIYPGGKKEDIRQLLDKCGAKEIFIDNYSDSFKEEFVSSYLNLVGRLGLTYNSIYWWATFTSSKNKFASKLFPNLFIFYSTIKTLRENPDKDILIINPPHAIINSIKKYCLRNSINLQVLSSPLDKVSDRIKEILLITLIQFNFILKTWVKIFISNKYLHKKFIREFKPDKYYVLRSWFYARSINENNKYSDSFFGTLPDYLRKKNQKLIIVAGVIGDYRSIVKKIANTKEYFIIPHEYFLKYSDPIASVINVYKNKSKIKMDIEFMGIDVTGIVKAELSKDYRHTASGEYLHSFYIRRMLSLFDIGTFTTTYENNPWEKVCFSTLKKYSPDTKTIGYQHAVLSKASVNMFMSKDEKEVIPIPDKIITTGKVTKNILIKYGNFDADKIKEGCGLRFGHIFNQEKIERNKKYKILITPEGVLSESVNLVNFVHTALKHCKELKIVVRPHPALPFNNFRRHLNFDIDSFPNISVSSNASVKKDMEEVDIVIYRGSSLSIEALMMGIPVIYIDLGDIISVDPLFECSSLKWIVRTEKELVDAVAAIYAMENNEYQEKWNEAKNYLNTYLYAITDERLNEFII